jgi:DNA replication protein DnaC
MPKITHKWGKVNHYYECKRCYKKSGTKVLERCERKPLTTITYRRLGIGQRYWKAELEDLTGFEVIQKYCDNIHNFKAGGSGLLLWGDNGKGKTYCAAIILKEAVRVGYTAMLTSPSEYSEGRIEQQRFDENHTLVERIEAVDFLVIDDIGKEHKTKSGWFEANFERLLRLRVKECKPTIITTNLPPRKFGDHYSKSINELIKEGLFPFNVVGPNFRTKKTKALADMFK